MTAPHIVDPAGLLGQALSDASPDLMRELLQTMINALLSADADSVCGAEWNARTADRNSREPRHALRIRKGRFLAIGQSRSVAACDTGWRGKSQGDSLRHSCSGVNAASRR